MIKNLSRTIVCLRILQVVYILIIALLFVLTFALLDNPQIQADVQKSGNSGGIFLIGMLFSIGLFTLLQFTIKGLRQGRFWAWVTGLCFFALCLPSICLPLGIFGLIWILQPDVRKHCLTPKEKKSKE